MLAVSKVLLTVGTQTIDRGAPNNGMGLSMQYLFRYTSEGEDLINRVVTGNETWITISPKV